MKKQDLFTLAKKAKNLEFLIEYLNKRYMYDKVKKNKIFDLVELKYKDFFINGKLNQLFVKLTYAYKLSNKIKNESVFLNFCKIQTID